MSIDIRKMLQNVQAVSIAKLNSTPLWNLILQICDSLSVEFNPSKLSVILFYTNMVASSQREGIVYE